MLKSACVPKIRFVLTELMFARLLIFVVGVVISSSVAAFMATVLLESVRVSPLNDTILLIDRVAVLMSIIDDRNPITDDTIDDILFTVFCEANPVGGAYGEIRKGLLLFDIYKFAFAIVKSSLSKYLLESFPFSPVVFLSAM